MILKIHNEVEKQYVQVYIDNVEFYLKVYKCFFNICSKVVSSSIWMRDT